jgi:polyhydroxybutyrate depolymerase
MTDRELELKLRDFFRTEAGEEPAPQGLLASVSAIPEAPPVVVPLRPRGWLLAAAVLLLVALLAGLIAAGSGLLHRNPLLEGEAPTPAVATVTRTQLFVDGRTRAYKVVAPSDAAVRDPMPVLLLLHGGNVTTPAAETTGGFDALAKDPGVIVVYPEGYQNSWNAGTCCQPATTNAIDDVAFIGALVDRLEATYPVDPARVFIGGDGTGGSMAYRAACELSERFAAVAVVSGPLLVDCNPATPISALHIHGTADTLFVYDGGGGACDGPCPPVAQTMEGWRQADGCSGTPTTNTGTAVVTTTFLTCAGGVAVEFIAAPGANTTWGAPGLDDEAVIWAFLLDRARVGGGSITAP